MQHKIACRILHVAINKYLGHMGKFKSHMACCTYRGMWIADCVGAIWQIYGSIWNELINSEVLGDWH
jgi:hypothetical protein